MKTEKKSTSASIRQRLNHPIIDSDGLTDPEAIETMGVRADFSRPAEAAPHADSDLVSLDEAEKRHIENVLRATAGNQTHAASILGIERKTLARKMKRLGITS